MIIAIPSKSQYLLRTPGTHATPTATGGRRATASTSLYCCSPRGIKPVCGQRRVRGNHRANPVKLPDCRRDPRTNSGLMPTPDNILQQQAGEMSPTAQDRRRRPGAVVAPSATARAPRGGGCRRYGGGGPTAGRRSGSTCTASRAPRSRAPPEPRRAARRPPGTAAYRPATT